MVGAGTTAELTADGGDTAVITFRLDRPDGLSAVASGLSATPSLDDGAVRLVSSSPQRDLFQLLRWADGAGVELQGLEVDRPTLDDIFLRLTASDASTDPTGDRSTDPSGDTSGSSDGSGAGA